jgi:hypothetical protein
VAGWLVAEEQGSGELSASVAARMDRRPALARRAAAEAQAAAELQERMALNRDREILLCYYARHDRSLANPSRVSVALSHPLPVTFSPTNAYIIPRHRSPCPTCLVFST